MLRLLTVAVLLITAAAVMWIRPTSCTPATISASASPPASKSLRPAASPGLGTGTGTGTGVPPGSVGVPVRLADPAALAVVRPGNRVDLLRLDDDGGRRTTPVASDALVLEVTGKDDPVTGGLLLALAPTDAERALAAPGRGFAILIRPG
ncbi:hypothetical protein AB0F81_40920 [Actinoplanes sp. NPDC024001]|uniref:hypothetical protein n=1 Tax=Actinoplanes sp. NPDC024001 TaxID=3154598 RepID=UPI0033EC8365